MRRPQSSTLFPYTTLFRSVGIEGRAAEDLGLTDYGAALRRREEIRHRREGREALRGGEAEGRQGRRSADPRSQIGRASCRERVEISVVAGALKRKRKEHKR